MNIGTLLAIVAIFLTVLGFVAQYFGWILKLRKEIGDAARDVVDKFTKFELEMGQRMTRVETSQSFFQKYIDDILPDLIHHPNTIEKDRLLEKFKDLDEVGLERLKCILLDEVPYLTARKDPMVVSYIFLLARIDQKIGQSRGCNK